MFDNHLLFPLYANPISRSAHIAGSQRNKMRQWRNGPLGRQACSLLTFQLTVPWRLVHPADDRHSLQPSRHGVPACAVRLPRQRHHQRPQHRPQPQRRGRRDLWLGRRGRRPRGQIQFESFWLEIWLENGLRLHFDSDMQGLAERFILDCVLLSCDQWQYHTTFEASL